MRLDSLQAMLSAVSWQTWYAVYIVAAIAITWAAYLGLDLKTTDRGIAATFFGWTFYALPYDQVRRVELAPMEMRFWVAGFTVYDSDTSLSRTRKVRKIYTNPFVRRVMIECADGAVVLVTPDDRDAFIREVNRRRPSVLPADKAALLAADDVIQRRIAQERADRAARDG
jgi:hypothetical protein